MQNQILTAMTDDNSDLDAPRKALLRRAEEIEAPLKGLSVMLGRNPSYLHTYVHRGSPRKLDGDDRKKLAAALNMPESDLAPPEKPKGPDKPPSKGWVSKWLAPKGEPIGPLLRELDSLPTLIREQMDAWHDRVEKLEADLIEKEEYLRRLRIENGTYKVFGDELPDPAIFRSLPLKSFAHINEDSPAILERTASSDFTDRPPQLFGVKEAYAVRVWNTTMEPVFKLGYVAWVHPNQPIRGGDDVIVRVPETPGDDRKEGSRRVALMIKTVVDMNQNRVMFSQYNPEEVIELPRSQILGMDLIVGHLRVRS